MSQDWAVPKKPARRPGREQLREWLTEQKLSQKAFAEQLGIHETHLSAILSGRDFPSLSLAARIEDLTGITGTDFAEEAA
jgi:transcriptional regulator with XRE-family HTH domain